MKVFKKTIRFLARALEPGFTTKEFELAHTRCEHDFEITDMIFEDGERNYPSQAYGFVKIQHKAKVSAKWDARGKCTTGGNRNPAFDLLRPHQLQREIDSASLAFYCLIGLIFTLFILMLLS